MIVAGSVEMYGYSKMPYSFLEQNAYPNNDFIFVDTVDWEVGDQIVIATSSFNSFMDEAFTITSVTQSSSLTNGFSTDAD